MLTGVFSRFGHSSDSLSFSLFSLSLFSLFSLFLFFLSFSRIVSKFSFAQKSQLGAMVSHAWTASERMVDQAVDAHVPQAMEGTVESDVAHAPAVTHAAPAPVIEYVECVAPSPALAFAATAPMVEYVASAPAHAYTAPAPVTNRTPTPVNEYVTAPAVSYSQAPP